MSTNAGTTGSGSTRRAGPPTGACAVMTSRMSATANDSTNDRTKELQSKAKDIEQRLAAAIVQQQQMLSTKRNEAGTSKRPDTLAQQQQQQISKNINRYRTILCETYADWILSSPATAVQYDVMNALWRSCFYGRIGPARIRMQKDQKKFDAFLTTTKATAATTAAMAKSLQEQKDSLHIFLKEGITLYDYLCQKLQQQLVQMGPPLSRTGRSDHENHAMIESDEEEEEDEGSTLSSNGIVPCLYRLYIHLGDLYRYGDTNHTASLASASYIKAMRIGPAYGHAFNQLAVIYQTKDATTTTTTSTTNTGTTNTNSNQNNTITTVYWYTRSLGAAQEPFATASSNLLRLFDSNRQWLQQEQNQKKKILLRPGSTCDSPSTKVVSTNQGNTSRLCLANFVDVQYTVYTMAKGEEVALKKHHHHHHHHHQADIPNWRSLKNQILAMMTSVQELLKNSSFSDSLQIKLITIMAFMEYHCQFYHSSSHTNENDTNTKMKLRILVRTMIYEMGYYMAERVHMTLTSKIQKQQKVSMSLTSKSTPTTTTTVPSIRVLLPLLLLTEYLLHKVNIDLVDDSNDRNSTEYEDYQDAYTLFWKTIIDVYNDILSLDCIIVNLHSATDTNQRQQRLTYIQEYQELRGFLPFESFLKCGGVDTNNNDVDTYLTSAGYLSDIATIQMMDTLLNKKEMITKSNQHRTTQESSSTGNRLSQGSFSTNISVSSSTTNNSSNPNNKEAMLMKLRRFIALRSTFVSRLQRQVRVHHTTDVLKWVDDNNDEYMDTSVQFLYHNNRDFDKNNVRYDDDDDGGDCIVAMMDDNEGTIKAINNLVDDENIVSTSTTGKDHITTDEKSRADDVLLLYQRNNDTNGPALLVPGAFLFESSEKMAARNDATIKTTATTSHNPAFDDVVHNVNITMADVKTGPTITPPPGFASTGSNPNLFNSISGEKGTFIEEGVPLYGNPVIHGESMILFGGPSALQTANPFASTLSDSRLFFDTAAVDSTTSNYVPSYGNKDADMMFGSTTTPASDDDALLFHSGLLKSLLMEETTTGGQQQPPQLTKNPFA